MQWGCVWQDQPATWRKSAEVATATARGRRMSARHPERAPPFAPSVGWCGVRWAVGGLPIRSLGTQADREGPRAQEDLSLEVPPQLSLWWELPCICMRPYDYAYHKKSKSSKGLGLGQGRGLWLHHLYGPRVLAYVDASYQSNQSHCLQIFCLPV